MGYVTKIHKHRGGDRMCVEGELKIAKGGKLIIDNDDKEIDVGERVNRLTEEIAGIKENGGSNFFIVTVAADENGNIIADHYLNDIAAAYDRGEIPVVKMSYEGETTFYRIGSISDTVALFYYVTLAGNAENADVILMQVHITDATVAYSMRNIFAQ